MFSNDLNYFGLWRFFRKHSFMFDPQNFLADPKNRRTSTGQTMDNPHLTELPSILCLQVQHLMLSNKLLSERTYKGCLQERIYWTFCCWILCFNYCLGENLSIHTAPNTCRNPDFMQILYYETHRERSGDQPAATWEYSQTGLARMRMAAQSCVTSTGCFSLI